MLFAVVSAVLHPVTWWRHRRRFRRYEAERIREGRSG